MRNLCLILSLFIIGACSFSQPKVDEAYLNALEEDVIESTKEMPIDFGQISLFLSELDKENLTLTHSYQLQDAPTITQEQVDNAKASVIAMLKETPSERMPIDKGLTMCYKYYTCNMDLLYTITITKSDLK